MFICSLDQDGVSPVKEEMSKQQQEKILQLLKKLSRPDEEIDRERHEYLEKLFCKSKKIYEGYEEDKYVILIIYLYLTLNRKRKIQKLREKKKEFVDFVKYKPNYNAIYGSVHSVKMYKPIYHKSNSVNNNDEKDKHLLIPKNISFIKEDYSKSMVNLSVQNRYSIKSLDLENNGRLEKKRSSSQISESKTKTCPSSGSNSQQNSPRRMNNKFIKIDPSKIKTISFEKTSGRSNKLAERRKTEMRYVNYSPNYDFIREDTKKTCKIYFLIYSRALWKR